MSSLRARALDVLINMSIDERTRAIDELWTSGSIASPIVRAMLATVGHSLSIDEHVRRWMRPLLHSTTLAFKCRLIHRERRLNSEIESVSTMSSAPNDEKKKKKKTQKNYEFGVSAEMRLQMLLPRLGSCLDGSSLLACAEVCSSWYEALEAGCGWCSESIGQQLLAFDLAIYNRGHSMRHSANDIATYFTGRLHTLENLTRTVPESVHAGGVHILPLLGHLTSLRALHIESFTLPKYGDGLPSLHALVFLERLYLSAFDGDLGRSSDRSFRLPPLPALVDCTLLLGCFYVHIDCCTLRSLVVHATLMVVSENVFQQLETLEIYLWLDDRTFFSFDILHVIFGSVPKLHTFAFGFGGHNALSDVKETFEYLRSPHPVSPQLRHLSVYFPDARGPEHELMAAFYTTFSDSIATPQIWQLDIRVHHDRPFQVPHTWTALARTSPGLQAVDLLVTHIPTFPSALHLLVAAYATGVSFPENATFEPAPSPLLTLPSPEPFIHNAISE